MYQKISQWHAAYQRDSYLLMHDVLDTGRLAKLLRRSATKHHWHLDRTLDTSSGSGSLCLPGSDAA